MLLYTNPYTGDNGLSPIILVLLIVSIAIILGCIIWAFVLNRKNSKIQTTVITITDEEETTLEQNTVEDILGQDKTEL